MKRNHRDPLAPPDPEAAERAKRELLEELVESQQRLDACTPEPYPEILTPEEAFAYVAQLSSPGSQDAIQERAEKMLWQSTCLLAELIGSDPYDAEACVDLWALLRACDGEAFLRSIGEERLEVLQERLKPLFTDGISRARQALNRIDKALADYPSAPGIRKETGTQLLALEVAVLRRIEPSSLFEAALIPGMRQLAQATRWERTAWERLSAARNHVRRALDVYSQFSGSSRVYADWLRVAVFNQVWPRLAKRWEEAWPRIAGCWEDFWPERTKCPNRKKLSDKTLAEIAEDADWRDHPYPYLMDSENSEEAIRKAINRCRLRAEKAQLGWWERTADQHDGHFE